MDKTDSKILSLLQENARITNAEIARQIDMVPSGVQERIRKLEEKGYISDYATHLSPELLDLGLLAFIFVRTSETPGEIGTAKKLSEIPEILEIHHVAGEDCYLLKVRLADNKSLANFMREMFGSIPEIKSTNSVIVLETIKETCRLNLLQPEE